MTDQLEAERAVLGAVLFSPTVLDEVADVLVADDFTAAPHRSIFEAMQTMAQRSAPIDQLTLSTELRRAGKLDAVGGAAYVAALSQAMPTAAAVAAYAGIVRENALRGRLRAVLADAIATAGRDDVSPLEAIGAVESALFSLAERRATQAIQPVRDVMRQALERLSKGDRRRAGLSTGFAAVDRIVGGLRPGELIILGARPSMGKTALALDVVRNVAAAGARALVFSIEMTTQQIGDRLLAPAADADLADLVNCRVEAIQWRALVEAGARVAGLEIGIDETARTPAEIRARSRREARASGLDLVVVDYLQLMHGDRRTENRNLELADVSGQLKALAKELSIPVLALSQLNRKGEERTDGRPQLSDLRDSGAIEQDADLVMCLFRPEMTFADVRDCPIEKQGIAELLIRKHRNGPTGRALLTFNKTRATFTDREAAP